MTADISLLFPPGVEIVFLSATIEHEMPAR
jgi:hypothetical protein